MNKIIILEQLSTHLRIGTIVIYMCVYYYVGREEKKRKKWRLVGVQSYCARVYRVVYAENAKIYNIPYNISYPEHDVRTVEAFERFRHYIYTDIPASSCRRPNFISTAHSRCVCVRLHETRFRVNGAVSCGQTKINRGIVGS